MRLSSAVLIARAMSHRPSRRTKSRLISRARTTDSAREALEIGACDHALHLSARRVAVRNPSPRDAATYVSALVGVGRDEEANEWASHHVPLMSATALGVGQLVMLGVWPTAPVWGDAGEPYLYCAYRHAVATDDPEKLVVELLRKPFVWFRHPQMAVVAYNALRRVDESTGLWFLRAFLGMQYPLLRPGEHFCNRILSGAASARGLHSGPRVSVIVSAFNAQSTVLSSVRSILDQDHLNLEVLVCDDASTDGTQAVVRELVLEDRRVRAFRSLGNQGPYNVRNHLLRVATGDLITFHDADDIAFPDRISLQVAAMQRHRADACIARWFRVRPSGEIVLFPDHNCVRRSLVSLMISRRAVAELPNFRSAAFGADLEYFEDVQRLLRVASISVPLLWGTWGAGSLTRQSGAEALENGFRSQGRRTYSGLLFERRRGVIAEHEMADRLAEAGLIRPDAGVVPVSS